MLTVSAGGLSLSEFTPCPIAGSEEGAEEAKQALLKEVGKVTDVVSSLGFSWWQGGPPHTQSLKDLHWVSTISSRDRLWFYLSVASPLY